MVFPQGDVTVVGWIASGAEVVAGGSIHVYGAIRGRALAGANGTPKARIFCSRAEPELLAIDGVYRTAEDIDASLHGRAIQVWLEGDALQIAAVDEASPVRVESFFRARVDCCPRGAHNAG